MSPVLYILVVLLVLAQILAPKKWAFVPLLIAACHTGNVEILPELTPVRIVIIVGIIRSIATGSFPLNRKERIDQLFIVFGCFAFTSAFFHSHADYNPFYARLGLILNVLGSYTYTRAYIIDKESFHRLCISMIYVLTPLSLCMFAEHTTGRNIYSSVSKATEYSGVRDGRVRAKGPFRHSILAGTAGASALVFIVPLWHRRKKLAKSGIVVCGLITFSSSSSGPLMTFFFALIALLAWKKKQLVFNYYRHFFVFILIVHFVSTRGIWYLMARIDLVGGSTGYHRARLIDSAITHLDRWWFAGTDYTRDWMPFAAPWSPNHVDITNYYISFAVAGGLPLLVTFMSILYCSFKKIGGSINRLENRELDYQLTLWCCGAGLFAHSVTFVSVTYFDQMFALFYILVGSIPALTDATKTENTTKARNKGHVQYKPA